jgi:hypothetical protein
MRITGQASAYLHQPGSRMRALGGSLARRLF